MSVIISRALPDARDGLKPSQRRILYAMHDLSLFPGRQHRKCAKICGDTSGNYHPHGEAVIYPTLVHMAQAWAMREPLVDGQGNVGSVEGDPPAAMRYTEARMTHLGAALMVDMDKETVDFVPNYDETRTEPTVFPAAFPNLLVNGSAGIAVGMATNMPPHNLGDTIAAAVHLIQNPDATTAQLLDKLKGPDFPLGGKIVTDRKSLRKIYEDGQGTLKIQADADRGLIMAYLYKHTQLQENFAVNMTCLVPDEDGKPQPMRLGLKEILQHFLDFRFETVMKRFEFELEQLRKRIHILEGFKIIFNALDKAIKLI